MIKSIQLVFRRSQFWIGANLQRGVWSPYAVLYIQPLPMVGVRIVFRMVVGGEK